jgi:hypothetical protein
MPVFNLTKGEKMRKIKNQQLHIRISEKEKKAFEDLSVLEGLSISTMVRSDLIDRCKRKGVSLGHSIPSTL